MQVSSKTALGLIMAVLVACSGEDSSERGGSDQVDPQTQRWYGRQQVETGRQVFAEHCAVCHGDAAQGLHEDWRQRLADGSFPPPPLNGSAHAWHHPLSVLMQVINEGGVPLGGQMPGFADRLNDEQKLAAIAYFQNFWSDDIYANWQQMGGTN